MTLEVSTIYLELGIWLFGIVMGASVWAFFLRQKSKDVISLQNENITALKNQAEIHERALKDNKATMDKQDKRIKTLEDQIDALSTIPVKQILDNQQRGLDALAAVISTQNSILANINSGSTVVVK